MPLCLGGTVRSPESKEHMITLHTTHPLTQKRQKTCQGRCATMDCGPQNKNLHNHCMLELKTFKIPYRQTERSWQSDMPLKGKDSHPWKSNASMAHLQQRRIALDIRLDRVLDHDAGVGQNAGAVAICLHSASIQYSVNVEPSKT